MYCHDCGKPLVDNAVYCSYCGVKIKKPEMCKSENVIINDVGKSNNDDITNVEDNELKNNDGSKISDKNGGFVDKLGHGIAYIGSFILILAGGAIGKQMARQPDFIRFLSYAMPGALTGFLLAVITVFVGRKLALIDSRKSIEFVIISVIVLVGVIGGIYWAVGGFVAVNIIIFLYKK